MEKLIRLDDLELKKHNIPYKASTLRFWRYKGLYPQLFKKIGYFVFLDLEKFQEFFGINKHSNKKGGEDENK